MSSPSHSSSSGSETVTAESPGQSHRSSPSPPSSPSWSPSPDTAATASGKSKAKFDKATSSHWDTVQFLVDCPDSSEKKKKEPTSAESATFEGGANPSWEYKRHAYKWFCRDKRLEVLRAIPEEEVPTYQVVMLEVNAMWRSIEDDTRQHYEEIARYECDVLGKQQQQQVKKRKKKQKNSAH